VVTTIAARGGRHDKKGRRVLVDLIVENGRIHTGEGTSPVVNSLAVLNGRVVAAGDEVDGLQARERVDARGSVVLPGFNDAHAHTVWFGTTLIEADLSGVGSLDDVYRVVEGRPEPPVPTSGSSRRGSTPSCCAARSPTGTCSTGPVAGGPCGSSTRPATPAS
jgi:hypothetical protein